MTHHALHRRPIALRDAASAAWAAPGRMPAVIVGNGLLEQPNAAH
jgi:hypothetical protein